MRSQTYAAVGNGGAVGGQLDGSEHVVALADGRLCGQAVRPSEAWVILRIFLRAGHDAGTFGQLHPGLRAQSEILRIGIHLLNPQIHACVAEKGVAGT